MQAIILFFIFMEVTTQSPTSSGAPKSKEIELLSYLFAGYNPNARPVKSPDDAVKLKFDIALRQLLNFNERKQIMTTNVWIRHYWNDPLLTWNASQWDGITYIAIDPNTIWKPDITLYNNAEREFQGFDDFGKTRVNVYSDGSTAWLLPVILRSQCKMDLTFFPFDTQDCPLIFGSWAYDGGALDFINRKPNGDLTAFSESGEFNVDSLKATRISKVYDCCPNPYYTIEYSVHLERKVKFYFFNLIIPGVLIALLSCFSFFLPPLSGERTGLIITNFLSISVYIMMVSDSVPPSSNVPLLVRFYTALTAEIGFALILNCIIIPLAARDTPMPRIIRVIFLEKLGYLLMCRRRTKSRRKYKKAINLNSSNSFINDDIFFERNMGNGVYKNGHALNNMNNNLISNNNQSNHNSANSIKNGGGRSEDMQLRDRGKAMTNKENGDISKKLQSIVDMMSDQLDSKRNNEDWEELTKVLDRVFYVLFVVTILMTVTILISSVPEMNM